MQEIPFLEAILTESGNGKKASDAMPLDKTFLSLFNVFSSRVSLQSFVMKTGAPIDSSCRAGDVVRAESDMRAERSERE